jgi:serine/threonine-protein kinase
MSCPTDIHEECIRHIPQIDAATPTIVFAGVDVSGRDTTAVAVTMDGELLTRHLDGRAIAIDPGEHTFRIEAAGQAAIEKKLRIQEGEKNRYVRFDFGALPPPDSEEKTTPAPLAPTMQSAVVSSAETTTSLPMSTDQHETSAATGHPGLSGQKLLGLVVGGTGVVGMIVGSILAAIADSKWSSAKNDCGAGCTRDDPAQQERRDALSAATGSTVAFVAGASLVGGGLALFLTAPPGSATDNGLRVVPSMTAGGGGVLLLGDF